MLRFAHLLSFRHRAAWLLALGLLAVALHVLAGTGMARVSGTEGGDRFFAEVCTSHGLFKADSSKTSDGGSQPEPGAHDCCKLCAAAGPLLVAALAVGVPLAVTFAIPHDSHTSAHPTLAVRTAHPPRGPPARA